MPRLSELVGTHERRKDLLWIALLVLLVGSMLMIAVPLATGSNPTLQLWAMFLAVFLVFLVLVFLALWLVGHRALNFVTGERRRRRRRSGLRAARTGETRRKARPRFSRLKED